MRRLRLGLFICVFVVTTYLIFIPLVTKNIFFDRPNRISDLTTEEQLAARQMQQFLYDEFKPGGCFGMPPGNAVDSTDIKFEKMKRDGNFIFSFSDGKCCQSTRYEIKIWKKADQFEYKIINQDLSSTPC